MITNDYLSTGLQQAPSLVLLNNRDHLPSKYGQTRCWTLSEGIIHGLVTIGSLRTIESLAQTALDSRYTKTDHLLISDKL